MKLLLNQEIPREQWDDLVEKSSFGTPFQTPEFYDFINSVNGLSSIAMAIEDKGEIIALVVGTIQREPGFKGYFSRRTIIYGGPIIRTDSGIALSVLLEELNKTIKSQSIYAEIRNLHDYSSFKINFSKKDWKYLPYLNFRVPCTTSALIWSNLNRLRKRQIKKALENNVVISETKNSDDINSLYNIIYRTYKQKTGKPIFNISFFQKLKDFSFCKVFVVKDDNKIIGGHFCLIDENTIYDWYGAGLDNIFKDFAPSTMSVYAALIYGAGHNIKYFDFMGAGQPDKAYGVRDFKAQFGGELVEFGRFIKIFNPILYITGQIGVKVNSLFKN